jgi:hypothetical protein
MYLPIQVHSHSQPQSPKAWIRSAILVLYILLLLVQLSKILLHEYQSSVLGVSSELSSAKILSLVNLERKNVGVNPLIINPQLEKAAQAKLDDMIANNYFAHSTESTNPWQFIDAQGYRYQFAGENLARDFSDEYQLIEGWLNSQTHKENLLSEEYQETGIAIGESESGVLVVQLFATPFNLAIISPPSLTDQLSQKLSSLKELTTSSSAIDFVLFFSIPFIVIYALHRHTSHRHHTPSISSSHWKQK